MIKQETKLTAKVSEKTFNCVKDAVKVSEKTFNCVKDAVFDHVLLLPKDSLLFKMFDVGTLLLRNGNDKRISIWKREVDKWIHLSLDDCAVYKSTYSYYNGDAESLIHNLGHTFYDINHWLSALKCVFEEDQKDFYNTYLNNVMWDKQQYILDHITNECYNELKGLYWNNPCGCDKEMKYIFSVDSKKKDFETNENTWLKDKPKI